jgi:hypothetical protein
VSSIFYGSSSVALHPPLLLRDASLGSIWPPVTNVAVYLLKISFEVTLDGIGCLARGGHGTTTTTGLDLVICWRVVMLASPFCWRVLGVGILVWSRGLAPCAFGGGVHNVLNDEIDKCLNINAVVILFGCVRLLLFSLLRATTCNTAVVCNSYNTYVVCTSYSTWAVGALFRGVRRIPLHRSRIWWVYYKWAAHNSGYGIYIVMGIILCMRITSIAS